jgi:hypothetical protein
MSIIYSAHLTELFRPATAGTTAVEYDTDTLKVALMATAHNEDHNEQFWSEISADEISGTGYAAGGYTLVSKTITDVPGNGEGQFDAADPSWGTVPSPASFSAYYAVLYKDTGVAATSPLIASWDFGGVKTVTSGTFTIQWGSEGVLNFTSP